MKFLDLSGYMFSGKSALSDLVQEFEGFHVPNYRSEFDLIRIPHGLMDLKLSLIDNWSWIRSDSAIREFAKLTAIMSRTPTGIMQKLFITGFGYEKKYNDFTLNTKTFINSITNSSWNIQWPYETAALSPLEIAKLKILSKIKGYQPWPEINYHLCSGEDFLAHAKKYLTNILIDKSIEEKNHTVVTHNMLEPYNPAAGFCFFNDIKAIIVDRDVRDIYITSMVHSAGYNDMVSIYSRIIGAFDIDLFIQRQKILRARTDYAHNDNVLRINFEDLVLDYENSLNKILNFLNITDKDHIKKRQHFNPDKSRKNIGLWKNPPLELINNIRILEEELPDLCYQ